MAVNTTVEVVMPAMGDSVSEGSILEWHKQEGDEVSEDETLVEISTDKVDAEVPAADMRHRGQDPRRRGRHGRGRQRAGRDRARPTAPAPLEVEDAPEPEARPKARPAMPGR